MEYFLVDRSELTRKSLKQYLSDIESLSIAGEAADAEIAMAEITRTLPDVIITDIGNTNVNALKFITTIKSLSPSSIVIVFMDIQYPQYKTLCLEAGADHFFKKPEEIENLYSVLLHLADNAA